MVRCREQTQHIVLVEGEARRRGGGTIQAAADRYRRTLGFWVGLPWVREGRMYGWGVVKRLILLTNNEMIIHTYNLYV